MLHLTAISAVFRVTSGRAFIDAEVNLSASFAVETQTEGDGRELVAPELLGERAVRSVHQRTILSTEGPTHTLLFMEN